MFKGVRPLVGTPLVRWALFQALSSGLILLSLQSPEVMRSDVTFCKPSKVVPTELTLIKQETHAES